MDSYYSRPVKNILVVEDNDNKTFTGLILNKQQIVQGGAKINIGGFCEPEVIIKN